MSVQEIDPNTMQEAVGEAANLLKIMAHQERLMVLCQLTNGEVGVGELFKHSSLTQSAFSQHLTVLRKHEIIHARKASQQVFYSLSDKNAEKLIGCLHSIFCAQTK
ncbi:metalloregulator ArsR/SmtB family transcription factor [Vibrio makurazakiensis]|uniref:ArsR/SmtB family transcription factor n=1 Tax=Vibrio makurazakiensis TaxID=2910250 RepID=UPI003D144579